MSSTPSIPTLLSSNKDPPTSTPTSTSPPVPRRTTYAPQRTPSYSSSPKDKDTTSMPPPPVPQTQSQTPTPTSPSTRPSHPIRTTSFDPNVQILNPSSSSSPSQQHIHSNFPHGGSQTLDGSQDREREGDQRLRTSSELQSKPDFAPFFTLVNDRGVTASDGSTGGAGGTTAAAAGTGSATGNGGGTYHPSRIHYIFSDDDGSEELTAALLRSAHSHAHATSYDDEEEQEGGSSHLDQSSDRPTTGTETTSSSSSATFRRTNSKSKSTPREKRDRARREERIIILDVNSCLDKVEKITSLSKDWQVLSAHIERAPSFDPSTGGDEGGGEADRGLMLKIEGVGVKSLQVRDGEKEKEGGLRGSASGSGSGLRGSGMVGMGEEEMHSLMEAFDRKMGVLRRVVAGSGTVGGDVGSIGVGASNTTATTAIATAPGGREEEARVNV